MTLLLSKIAVDGFGFTTTTLFSKRTVSLMRRIAMSDGYGQASPPRRFASSWSSRGGSSGGRGGSSGRNNEVSGRNIDNNVYGYNEPGDTVAESTDGFPSSSRSSSSYSRTPGRDIGRPNFDDGSRSSFGGGRGGGGRGRFQGNSSPNRYRYSRDNGGYESEGWGSDKEDREPPCGRYDGDHIYGISPIRLAIASGRRNISELIIQEGMELSNKKDEKTAGEILKIAKEKGITIREFPKHDLNMLTENRPHQGFVLRAAPLQFQRIDSLPASDHFACVLALDEVWDPQNFGALLRTSHFLGVDKVIVCAKNSAPLSPAVSKASSGALEVMQVGSTDNMMRFLDKSMENGWQVVGTALGETATNLDALPLTAPTILVLGNEGHGVRTNILRRCTHLVKIPGAESGNDFGVDSLNVSVTGGILLHHILQAKKKV